MSGTACTPHGQNPSSDKRVETATRLVAKMHAVSMDPGDGVIDHCPSGSGGSAMVQSWARNKFRDKQLPALQSLDWILQLHNWLRSKKGYQCPRYADSEYAPQSQSSTYVVVLHIELGDTWVWGECDFSRSAFSPLKAFVDWQESWTGSIHSGHLETPGSGLPRCRFADYSRHPLWLSVEKAIRHQDMCQLGMILDRRLSSTALQSKSDYRVDWSVRYLQYLYRVHVYNSQSLIVGACSPRLLQTYLLSSQGAEMVLVAADT